ncbi:MAG: type III-B CRISPR module RAMP protein Cmr6 [Kiritimatiellaeota bacterium]|nr:type III-B CRISPR module RAMP protein Cmr6 [Kiritimatiellota bacterium]
MITMLNEIVPLQSQTESPSLRLQKYVRLEKNSKKAEIEAVVNCHNRYAKPVPPFAPLPGTIVFEAKLEARLIINQAGGILENAGICLHPHFGSPVIPGSAVKGIARHAAWCENQSDTDDMKRIFGDVENGGTVSFLPAIAKGKAALVTDIINCHHMGYYAGKMPQAMDNEQPNPQFFPAVEKGASFCFTLIPLRGAPKGDVEMAKAWLLKAVTEHGAGAKVNAGYGWFSFDVLAEERERERAAEEEQKRLAEAQRQQALAALSPLDRAIQEILALGQEPFAHFAKAIATKTPDEQRAFITVLKTNKDKKEWWKTKKKKDTALADAIRSVAAQVKEELP